MNPQRQELLQTIQGAQNILVTISANPSVDQLAACIGITLVLNKLKKHATAVFSGAVPSTIDFLKPEDTIEKNTDSLRDFIISLDKSKADKLRYKVENQVVRIFITPYRTSITDKDLDFSQGDFNVDVVLFLGVNSQQDLDQAITSHGRILHDATVVGIGTRPGGELGSINWVEPGASSLSELVTALSDDLGKQLLDSQIATALLTGIVAETDRFSNEKTSPETMRLSAELMSAGANQQLVASELAQHADAPELPVPTPEDQLGSAAPTPPDAQDGTLDIVHTPDTQDTQDQPEPAPEDTFELPEPQAPPDAQPILDEPSDEPPVDAPSAPVPASRIMLQPPSLTGTLTANSVPQEGALQDPLSETLPGADSQIMPRQRSIDPTPQEPEIPEAPAVPDSPTLSELEASSASEQAVADASPAPVEPVEPIQSEDLDAARDAVLAAIDAAPTNTPLAPAADTGATGYLNVQDLPDETGDTGLDTIPDLTDASAGQAPIAETALPAPQAAATTTPAPVPAEPPAPPVVPPPLPLDELSKFMAPPNQPPSQ